MNIDPQILVKIYLYGAIIGTVIFVLKTTLPIGSDTEITGDFNSSFDTDASFNFFTIESIAAFFMTTGWLGWFSLSQLKYDVKFSMLISIITGVVGMFLFSYLITQFKKLEHNPKVSINETLNKKGRAYLNFKPKGSGKIQIEFNSKLEILDAKNNSDEEIKTFDSIKVVKVENNEIFIEKDSL